MIECIITSSVLIAVVIALRFLFRGKISCRLQYALWGLVLLRLLMPFPLLGSPLSVMNAIPDSMPISGQHISVTSGGIGDTADNSDNSVLAGNATGVHYAKTMSANEILRLIWLVGAIVVGLWILGTNFVFYRLLHKTRRTYDAADFKLPVYVSGHIASPCLFGIIHPGVYLTPKAAEDENNASYVLAHELCHYRHGDHIWSILRGVCLVAYWWNPLVWAAAILSRADSELACDESVIKQIGEEKRLAYGHALVDMITVKKAPSGILYAATTMISGKRGIKERLNMIIKKPKTFIPAMVTVLLAVAVCVGGTFTGAKAASLSAEEALTQLAASAYHTKDEVSFQIPQGYEKPEKWNIHIAGRLESDGFSQSVHLLEDVNDSKTWKPGERYSLPLNDHYTELTLTAYLPGENGKTLEKTVNLLNTPSFSVSYSLTQLKNGKVQSSLSPLSGDKAKLAEDLIFDYMVKSAAWPGVDIKTLNECYLLRATYPDGTATDYYAYLHDGKSVMQQGTDGYYSRIDDGLYEKLADLAQGITAAAGSVEGSTNTTVNIDRSDLNACVSDAIITANTDQYHSGDFSAEAHTVLKTVESGNTTTVYAMALYMEFGYANGGFSETGGSHMPVAVTFEKNDAGKYDLKEYWMPKDGTYYAPSIKEKFPSDIYKNALDTQKYILAQTQACYAQAVKYSKVNTDAVLSKLVDTICSSPAEASNPGAYIEEHPIEYRALLYYGDYTLRYAYAEFLKGVQTDLRGQILLSAMRELLGEENIGKDIGPAQKWFDEWKDNALSLRDANSMEFMEKNYPKTAILLQMLDKNIY
ncbi:Methicillin resistance mecR1 protein [Pelotomaculum sp. FP]|uniref:M56 family metallopeptidase n=1 Tax=Pelotomaculum sp. FP TaxID=261474 RepID=UPI0010653960|nr:M56 family metallopeptidase [Pelotomaculum sp. FP]TEB14112.1 Methicillin resistance mecR1 protein [Pelotomaculum sp. FP]